MPSDSKQEWRENTLDPVLKRFGERRDSFETGSGIEEDILYTREDRPDSDGNLGYPGEYPYTRGVQPTMYRGRLWTMRQYAGMASPEESNRRYRYLLEQGQNGLSVAFDLPTQTGYDSDHPMAQGEIGRTGVPISSLSDMEALFDGIPLDRVSTSMTINATASVLLALYIAVARKQGVGPEKLNGTIQNDILKEYIARGDLHIPSQALDASCNGHIRLLFPERSTLEHNQHQRLSHGRGRRDSRPGTRFYLLQRHCIRPGGG